jgi:hypothetical protein
VGVVVCPGCGGEIEADATGFRCKACGAFPNVGRVPCLLPDPERYRRLWRAQLAVIHAEGEDTIAAFGAELRKPGLLRGTRERLTEQVRLTRVVMDEIDAVFGAPIGGALAEAKPIPGFSPLETIHLVHRDWSWPESDENERALEFVASVLSAPLGRTLVLGAGACRLAYDLHTLHGGTFTLALDIDPMVLLIADDVLAGRTLTLTEPRATASELGRLSAVRSLAAPRGPAPGLHLLIANGLAPPLKDGAFDTVVTPWFIDLVPGDLREFFGVVTRLLAPRGRFVHYGPLLYPLTRPGACRYSREEIEELVVRAGYELERRASEVLRYSFSPLGQRGRLEPCYAFSAMKTGSARDVESGVPSFIVLPYLPVPDFAGRSLFHHKSAAYRLIVGLIDGERSIDAITRALSERTGSRADALKDAVRQCLIDVHPACTSSQ